MSASGAASSVGSEGSGATALDAAMLRADDDPNSGDRAFQTGVWGVLYTVSKEKGEIPYWFVIFRLFMDFWQLALLMVNPLYGFDIPAKATWWRIISFIQMNAFMSARGYTFFIIALYLMVTGLVLAVALSVWVAYSFQNNNFSHVWPIQVLRAFGTIFFQVLDVASMTVFLMAVDCQYFDIHPAENRYHNAEFPTVMCWTMPHLIHVVVAIVSLVVFVIMAALYQMGDMELNLVNRNPLAMAHSKVEVVGFFLKVVMTCASVFVTNIKWLAVIQLFSSTMLVAIYVRWIPHYYNWTNHVRVATYAAVLWSAILFTAVAFHWSVDWKDLEERQDFKHGVTLALWIGLVPCALLGSLASWLRLRYFHVTILDRFRNATDTTKPREIFVFRDAREVEILARCCRVFVDAEDNLAPGAVKLAEQVIKMGLAQLPKDPFMVIFHSSFLIDVQQSYQSGYTQLQAAKKMDPSFLERFAIFTREQQHTQKSSGGVGGSMDLVAYVEFQRNYSLVLKAHREALMASRFFWSQLLHHKVHFESLSKCVQHMDMAVRATDKAYRLVLQRHSNNVKMLRLYAKFLEHVKHDPWGAAKWFAEADKVEVQEEEAKENNILQELQLEPDMRNAFLTSRPVGTAGEGGGGGTAGVILINAFGIVQMANEGLNGMLGYGRKELHGKSVNLIIPPPFSSQHDGYLRTHMATGRVVIQGRVNNMLCLHRDGRFIPVRLRVVKVSGTGEDAMFLGMIEDVPSPPNTATVWVLPSGAVMSGDAAYTDICGFKATDVAGMPLSGLVNEAKEVLTVLKSAGDAVQEPKPIEGKQEEEAASDPLVLNSSMTWNKAPTAKFDAAQKSFAGKSTSFAASVMLEKAGSMAPSSFRRNSRSLRWDAVRVTTAKDSAGHVTSWSLSNVSVNHKFADPVHVSITIVNGGIGLHTFHVLKMERRRAPAPPLPGIGSVSPGALAAAGSFLKTLSREDLSAATSAAPPPPNYMLVADAKGRVAHVTEALSTRLGSTPKLIMANNAQRAFESLLMEPLAQLHSKHITAAPPLAFPAFSCRAGLSVLLAHRSAHARAGDDMALDGGEGRGTAYVPFRMTLKKKVLNEVLHHVATFKEVKAMQALAERRLLLSVNTRGEVLRVSRRSPKSLFGFRPSCLVGRNLSKIIDVLKQDGAGDPKPDTVLAEMAMRAMEAPGVSWRVGIQSPEETDGAQRADNTLIGRIKTRSMRPAVMRMFVREQSSEFDEERLNRFAQLPRLYSFEAEDEEQLEELEELQEEEDNAMQAAADLHAPNPQQPVPAGIVAEAEDDALDSAVDILGTAAGLGGSKKELGNLAVPEEGAEVNVVIDVELWRADLLMGFLQLDVRGAITGASTTWDHMLYDASLVVGADPVSLEGTKIEEILPCLKGKAPTELFNPQLSQRNAKKRGALKTPATGESSRVGILQMLDGVNLADQEPMSLVVQAVRRSGGFWVVLRPHQPHCGRPDFKTYIMRAAAAAAAAADGNEGSDRSSPAPSEAPAPTHGAGFKSMMQVSHIQRSALTSPAGAATTVNGDELDPQTPRQHAKLGDATDGETVDPEEERRREALHRNLSTRMPSTRKHESIKAWISSGGKVYPFDDNNQPQQEKPVNAADGAAASEHGGGQRALLPQPSGRVAWPAAVVKESPRAAPDRQDLADDDDDDEDEANGGAAAVARGSSVGSGGSHDAQHLDDAQNAENMVDDQDYKRGQRFKKLTRLLNSPAVYNVRKRFHVHTLALVAMVLVVHIGLFVLIFLLLKSQATYVNLLNRIGRAATLGADIAIAARDVQLIMTNATVPGLKGLSGREDLIPTIDLLRQKTKEFQVAHTGAFLGYDGKRSEMPTAYGLRALWESPSLPETNFYAIYANETGGNNTIDVVTNDTTTLSLFRTGNRISSRALEISQNGLQFEASGGNLNQWPQLMYILKNFEQALAPGYLTTMDLMVSYVIDKTHQVNNVQLIILAAEGIAMCLLAVAYMAYLSNTMAKHRYNMYSVFMTIPASLVRQLATKRLNLTEEDDDDEDVADPTLLAAKNAANASALAVPVSNVAATATSNNAKLKGSNTMDRNNSSKQIAISVTPAKANGIWARLAAHLPRLRRASSTTSKQEKRNLIRSNKRTMLFVMMFVVWGALVVAINAIGFMSLQAIQKPIATFNIVNHVCVLYKRNIFYIQELCTFTDVDAVAKYRAFVTGKLNDLKFEFMAMVYGRKVLPVAMQNTPHFAPVEQGIAYSLQEGADLLFNIKDTCLAEDQSLCPAREDEYYEVYMNGVNQAFIFFLDMGTNIAKLRGLDPGLGGPEFEYYWTSRTHLMGGFNALNAVYEEYVLSKYTKVRVTHVVLLVLTLATFVIFLFFILRPFMTQTANEPRRIAELLSQLPPDVDVESVLQLKLLASSSSAAAAVQAARQQQQQQQQLQPLPDDAAEKILVDKGGGSFHGSLEQFATH